MRGTELTIAANPLRLPLRRWVRVLQRALGMVRHDSLTVVAGGCAFFALLAMFPAIAAALVIYGLIADPADVAGHLTELSGVLPGQANDLVLAQVQRLVSASEAQLGLSFIVSFLITFWTAGAAARAMIGALNIVYGQTERRGWLHLNATVFAFTISGIVGFLVALTMIALVPLVLQLGGFDASDRVVSLLRWPVLATVVLLALMALYRFAPSRRDVRWQWTAPGALLALALWLISSIAFSYYVGLAGNFARIYGSFGALIILMLWYYLSFFVVLLGAEVNAELEHEMVPDTTVGAPRRLGHRGATMADHVAGRG